MKPNETQVEVWRHPGNMTSLILCPERDAVTHEARRKIAAEIFRTNPDDLTLRFEVKTMLRKEVEAAPEFEG